MEEQKDQVSPQEGYVPRPAWQVWAARAGLVIALLLVLAQFLQLATAGR